LTESREETEPENDEDRGGKRQSMFFYVFSLLTLSFPLLSLETNFIGNTFANLDSFSRAIEEMRQALEESKVNMSPSAVKTAQDFLVTAQTKLEAFRNDTQVKRGREAEKEIYIIYSSPPPPLSGKILCNTLFFFSSDSGSG
jgi:hypothetical protein